MKKKSQGLAKGHIETEAKCRINNNLSKLYTIIQAKATLRLTIQEILHTNSLTTHRLQVIPLRHIIKRLIPTLVPCL